MRLGTYALHFMIVFICFSVVIGFNRRLEASFLDTDELKDGVFPIIVMAVGFSDNAFSQVKKWGATHVHRYGMGMSIEADEPYFDLAARYGLKVMSDLSGGRRTQEEGGLDAMQDYVQRFKDHPALGFWYLYDEPSGKISANDLRPYYEMIKSEAPHIPVGVAHAWTTGWGGYQSTQDILMNDAYPVTGQPFPEAKLDNFTRFTESAVRNSPAVIPILQIFNWKVMAGPGDKEVRGFPLEQLRYPNDIEMRHMVFASIAMGAEGLAFYSHARSVMDDREWGDRILVPLLQEVKSFIGEIAGARMRRLGRAGEGDFYMTVWNTGEKTFAMLVSGLQEARPFQMNTLSLLSSGTLVPWGTTRDSGAVLENGRIDIDSLEPWEILIWEVTE